MASGMTVEVRCGSDRARSWARDVLVENATARFRPESHAKTVGVEVNLVIDRKLPRDTCEIVSGPLAGKVKAFT